MLDYDLALLYEMPIRVLKLAVRRNLDRFPEDFMFELTIEEARLLRSQFVILKVGRGQHSKFLPFAFTEQGVAMLSGILNSPKAIQTNIAIMRAFVAMRHFAWGYAELAQKLAELEAKNGHEIADIHEVLRWLGDENQARANEIDDLQTDDKDWENRERIGFKA